MVGRCHQIWQVNKSFVNNKLNQILCEMSLSEIFEIDTLTNDSGSVTWSQLGTSEVNFIYLSKRKIQKILL
jgi:hypothetical protein